MILKIVLSILILIFSGPTWAEWPRFVPVEKSESGIGKWQELPFGGVRLLSCTTGVKGLSMVVGGLQVKLADGWTMKKPSLRSLDENIPVWMESPLRPGSGKNTTYQGEVFFPLVFARNLQVVSPFNFGLQGDFPVCYKNRCMTLPLQMHLSLPADESDYTTACAYILDQQKQVPLLGEVMGVKGAAWTDNDDLVMAFEGIKNPSIAFLQTPDQDDFQVVETQLEKTGLIMRVKTNPWTIGQKKEWILITNKGAFRVPVLMQENLVHLPPSPLPFSTWWLGWNFIFFTPLFIWWGLGVKRTNKEWQREILKFCWVLPVLFCFRLIFNQYFSFDWGWYTIFLLSLVCIFPPQKKETAFVLFLIWPYFPKVPEMPFFLLVVWFFVMLLEMLAPFAFLYVKTAEVGKILRSLKQKNFFMYNLTFLFPTVILLMGSIWGVFQNKISYQNELNQNGFTVIAAAQDFEGKQKIPEVFFVDPTSVPGETLQKMYERKTPLVIWQDEWGRVILPPNSSLSDLFKFISNWQTYHALYKP